MNDEDKTKEGRINDEKERARPFLMTQLFALLTSGVGIVAILGWILGAPILASFSNSLIPMAPSTAILFVSFGIAVLLCSRFPKSSWFYKAGIIISSIGTLIALLLLFLSYFGIHPAVEHLGFKIVGSISGAPLGYISPLTALCFVLAGLAFLISLLSSERQKVMLAALSFVFLVCLISIILLLARLFGTPLLYGTQFIPPALSTSLALFFLGAALMALISPKIWQYISDTDAVSTRSSLILILVFALLATGIILAGYFYYIHNVKEYRLQKEQELSSVADLKISELTHIRKEWVEDASLFHNNTYFSTLVDRYFNDPKDIKAPRQLRTWLGHFRIVNNFNKLSLLDNKGVERFSEPDSPEPRSSTYRDKISEAIKSGNVTIVDFYKNEKDQHIYLNILVPIPNPKNKNQIAGVLSVQINPEEYLYPYIKSWPTPSKTSETMLVRREGEDVLYLNEVKLQQNTALSLRIPLKNKTVLAVRAVLGEEGIVEGYDYRNVHVLGDIHHIPDSPWLIITKIDIAEVYAPLSERLWLMIFLVTALLFGAGTSVAVVWRRHRARFYQERVQTAETLRDSYELLEKVFNNTHILMAYLDTKFNFIKVNNAYAEADKHTPDFYPNKNHFTLFPYAENEALFRKVVETGQSHISFAKSFEYAENPERGISYWDWSLQPVKASDGSVTALVLSLINVTERMQAQERVQKLNRIYALLSNINQAIVRIHDINLLFNEICRIAVEDGKFRMVWIGMINPQTNMVDVAASAGLAADYLNKIKIDLNDKAQIEGPTLKAIRSGHFTISNDIAKDESMIPWRDNALKLGYRSSASFPIKVLGTVRGVIKFYASETEFFSEDEIKLIDEMAMDVSFALEFIEHEAKRKEAEEFLVKFRLGVECSGDAVFLTDPDGTIVYVNPAFENIFGYTKEEAIGKTPRILKSGILDKTYYRDFWNSLLTQKSVIREKVNKTKDGRLLSIEATINPIINERGDIIGYLAIERDITESKHAKEELRKNEELLRTVLNNTPITIFATNSHGIFTLSEGMRLERVGLKPGENVGVSAFDLYGSFPFVENSGKVTPGKDVVRRALDGETVIASTELNGVHFENHIGPLLSADGTVVGIVGLAIDVTERKHAEEEIKMLAFALRSVNECVSITDLEDRLIFVNESFKKTYGYSEEELIGQNIHIVHSPNIPPDVEREILPATLRGGWTGEILNRKKDGNEFPILLSTTIIHDSANQPVALIGVAKDITDRKRAEQELIMAKDRAEESDRLKSAFLANMSHEIRTPMNGILGFAGLLKEPNLTGEEQQQYIQVIEKSGARMLNIINDIVSISKVESGQMEVTISETNINEQIEYIHSFFKPEAEQKGIQLTFKNSLSVNESVIKTDREKIYAILTNLVKNAIKFTNNGSIEFGYDVVETHGRASLQFFVKDTGPGVRQDQKEFIFERFRQGSESLNRNYEGAGLGLSISKAYVGMLGGKIWVESYPEGKSEMKGSTFYFTIPYKVEPEEKKIIKNVVSAEGEDYKTYPEGSGLKILIAEDDEESSKLISMALRVLSKEILNVRTGVDAVEDCRNNPDIDLVMMDIKMPGMDGFEAIKQIRGFNKAVIIIVQTAYALSGDREKALEAGCNDYISKPILKEKLLALVQKYFDKNGKNIHS
ncbi:MAG: PAS domain S-box protein [Bacteroidia bacterium]|nr:PAS domain S-box protein [Bacteroidia bacterium]